MLKNLQITSGKYMFTEFAEIIQPFIEAALEKNTSVLALIMFYEKISYTKAYIVLSCVIYNTIKNYV